MGQETKLYVLQEASKLKWVGRYVYRTFIWESKREPKIKDVLLLLLW
jgi:hypothetical protein